MKFQFMLRMMFDSGVVQFGSVLVRFGSGLVQFGFMCCSVGSALVQYWLSWVQCWVNWFSVGSVLVGSGSAGEIWAQFGSWLVLLV